MAEKDSDENYEAEMPREVSRLQDIVVTVIVALIGTAVSLGVYLQAGFGVVPALCVGSGLFIWLLSAHFLITRMRLKRLINGRLTQLSRDVKKLKNELQVTELLAEGHNDLLSGQDALEKAIQTIVQRMDQYDNRLKVLHKVGKLSLEKPKREELTEQSEKLQVLGGEFQKLSSQLQNFEFRNDQASQQQFSLMKAQLDVLELVVRQLGLADDSNRAHFAQKAIEAIDGLRGLRVGQTIGQQAFGVPAMGMQTLGSQSGVGGLGLPPLNPANMAMSPVGFEVKAGAGAGFSEGAAPMSTVSDVSSGFNAASVGGNKAQNVPQHSPLTVGGQLPKVGTPQGEDNPLQDMSEQSLLAAINEAIEANRIELFLQPIVGLPDRELMFYEAFSRLRNDLGQLILPRDFMPVAEMAELAPIIDNQIILRIIQVIQRLVERGKGRKVFCNLSLNSLRDADFFAEFMDFMEANRWLSQHLIFEFSQEAVEQAGAYEVERMTAIAKMGFKFSLDQITRLDIDFKALADRRFGYVKVNSSLLLGNMEGSKAQIHSADLNHYLNRLNITLIVDKVEREAVVRQLRDYNVNYAQGVLFCEPKPVRPDVFDEQGVVAA